MPTPTPMATPLFDFVAIAAPPPVLSEPGTLALLTAFCSELVDVPAVKLLSDICSEGWWGE